MGSGWSCGFVVGGAGSIGRAETHGAQLMQDMFVLNPEDYAAADDTGEIIGIVHSHPKTAPVPSEADKVSS